MLTYLPLLSLVLALGTQPDGGSATGSPSTPVRGGLDKEVIRGVIRAHIDDVKACYEPQLSKHPALFGRIMVQFTIAASGAVIASVLQDATMHDEVVVQCTVLAVRKWHFPKPDGGGIVIVSYPFVLTPVPLHLVSGGKSGGDVDIDFDLANTGILVHRSTDPTHGVPSNGLIRITKNGLMLVDTAWTEAQTEGILKWGEHEYGRSWVGAVITHDHDDRDGGLGALARRHIPVQALDLTVVKLSKRGVRDVGILFSAKAGQLTDHRGFEAFYPGPGHAPDNIVLRFDGDVVFGGCLIKSLAAKDLGFTGDADLAAWPAAVQRVAAKFDIGPDARAHGRRLTIIPGHGPIDPTGAAFQHTLDLLTAPTTKQAPQSRPSVP